MHMTQQGVKNEKKRFHNRLAALRTASKVEIEAADNIFQIMGFSAQEKIVKLDKNKIKLAKKNNPMVNGKNLDKSVILTTITLSKNIDNVHQDVHTIGNNYS